jgi:glycosyltransferase involved in cell wall biosynthesis
MPEPALSLCLRTFPGTNQALAQLSRATGLTRHVTLASPDPAGAEVTFLAAHLRERRPPLVLLGGWAPAYAALVDALRAESIRFAAYWTSSAGQIDISQEMPKLVELLAHPRIEAVLFSSPHFPDALAPRANAYYLPLVLAPPFPPDPRADWGGGSSPPRAGRPCTITLFCSPPEYRRKNVTNCLLALSGLRGDYRLLVNGLSRDAPYRALLDTLGIRYEERGWMERPDYEATLGEADLGLQVSFAETFGYVVAEHLLRGVPVVGSRMVPVLHGLSPPLRERMLVDAADDAREIRDRVQFFLDHPDAGREIGRQAREHLLAENAATVERARAMLAELIRGDGPHPARRPR